MENSNSLADVCSDRLSGDNAREGGSLDATNQFAQAGWNGYVWGMTVEDIKEAIVHLSETERQRLAAWFDEMQEDEWDRQMGKDLSPGGRGGPLLKNVDREIEAGNFTSLEEGLRLRRLRRAK